jgi:hypothetical protein
MPLVATTASKFSAFKLFAGFNGILLAEVIIGVICARNMDDLYNPVPLDVAPLVLTGLAWLIAGAALAFLYACLRAKQQLQNFGALLFALSFIEFVLGGYATVRLFTTPQLNHQLEERAALLDMLATANKNPAPYARENFTLSGMEIRIKALLINYKVDAQATTFYANDKTQALLRKDACSYLSAYSPYDTIRSVVFIFRVASANALSMPYTAKDCSAAPAAVQTPSPAPATNIPAPVPASAPVTPPATTPSLAPVTPLPHAESTSLTISAVTSAPSVSHVNDQLDRLDVSISTLRQSLVVFNQKLEKLSAKATLNAQ